MFGSVERPGHISKGDILKWKMNNANALLVRLKGLSTNPETKLKFNEGSQERARSKSLNRPEKQNLGEKGIDCIFVGYAKHFKAYRPKDIIPNVQESQMDDHTDDVPNEILEKLRDREIKLDHNTHIAIVLRKILEPIMKLCNLVMLLSGKKQIDMILVQLWKSNTGKPVDQLEYSRAIGCLMYAMTSTRPDIAYAIGKLSRFTSNPSRQHWKAITRVFKVLERSRSKGIYQCEHGSLEEPLSSS
ncbi:hypothetical protein Tco_0179437 [Tanacetum coccineum]